MYEGAKRQPYTAYLQQWLANVSQRQCQKVDTTILKLFSWHTNSFSISLSLFGVSHIEKLLCWF